MWRVRFVHDAYKVTRLASSDTERPGKPGVPEYLMWTVQRGDSDPVFVCVVYRPPSVSLYKNDIIDKLEFYCSESAIKLYSGIGMPIYSRIQIVQPSWFAGLPTICPCGSCSTPRLMSPIHRSHGLTSYSSTVTMKFSTREWYRLPIKIGIMSLML